MLNTVERFSDRVDNYVKYRPDYPRAIVDLLKRECALTTDTIVADLGCGTGISCRMFLENGNRVIGVEPNAAMRMAAVCQLAGFPLFEIVDGTAEKTDLPDRSVDMIVAAQAFHWFDPERTRAEFRRIIRPGGHIILIWNERCLDADRFHVDYEAWLLKYGRDYEKVRHDNMSKFDLDSFFPGQYKEAIFDNYQELDLEGLKGRALSASYMPNEEDERFVPMAEELKTLFANNAENGKIKILYNTKVFYSPIDLWQ